jgi:transposase InsO family protein
VAENSEHASALVRRAVIAAGCIDRPAMLHVDNRSPQKGSLLMATLERRGVMSSRSRPHVSDDNADAETLFRTLR